MTATSKTSPKYKQSKWSKRELDFLKNNYGYLPTREIAKQLNRTYNAVRGMAGRKGIERVAQREYAVYFDDEYQFSGTSKECADQLGIQEETFIYYTMPVYKKRAKTGIHIVDLGLWKREEVT